MQTESDKKDYKGFFLNLLSAVLLYTAFISLIHLLYNYVDIGFEQYNFPTLFGLQLALATLIITFPVYLWTCWQIHTLPQPGPKFFYYLSLFLIAIIIIFKAINLELHFFTGEISSAFLTKTALIIGLSGAIGYFYLGELKQKWSPTQLKQFALVATVIFIATAVYGFYCMGMPSKVRAADLDQQRVNNLVGIQFNVATYYEKNKNLPQVLNQAQGTGYTYVELTDPVSHLPYTYKVLSSQEFELCAHFDLSSSDPAEQAAAVSRYYFENTADWQHEAGLTCFTRNVNDLMQVMQLH